jgi:predicted nucleic acid-binding protein
MIVADASWVIALSDPGDVHHVEASVINDAMATEEVLLHAVTFAECLVGPAKLGMLDDAVVALLSAFEIIDVDSDAPVRWAASRARTGLRLPDVIVLDAALRRGARAIATFDDKLATRAIEHDLEVLGSTAR